MTKKQKFFSMRQGERQCTLVLIKLVREFAEAAKLLCADDFYEACLDAGILPRHVAKNSPILFRTFNSAGWIRKTKQFTLSRRLENSSSPLPLYECIKK